jgi:hypothetical protein
MFPSSSESVGISNNAIDCEAVEFTLFPEGSTAQRSNLRRPAQHSAIQGMQCRVYHYCLLVRNRFACNRKPELADLLQHPKDIGLFIRRASCPAWALNKTQKDVIVDF